MPQSPFHSLAAALIEQFAFKMLFCLERFFIRTLFDYILGFDPFNEQFNLIVFFISFCVFVYLQINLRLILVSGKTKEFLFSPSDSAGDIAQTVFDQWPEGKFSHEQIHTNCVCCFVFLSFIDCHVNSRCVYFSFITHKIPFEPEHWSINFILFFLWHR